MHVQNLDGRVKMAKNCMSELDLKGEESGLHDDEVQELHELSVCVHSMARVQTSMNWQKARSQWLSEGDANTIFFTESCLTVGA